MAKSSNYFRLVKILILCLFLFSFFQKDKFDPRIVGRWMNLYSKDASENKIKDEFAGKGYIDTFAKNGVYIIDPNYLRDDMKRNGIKEPLDYSLIPTFSWKTIGDEILVIDTGQESRQSRYQFSGDTLIIRQTNGITQYLLKIKK